MTLVISTVTGNQERTCQIGFCARILVQKGIRFQNFQRHWMGCRTNVGLTLGNQPLLWCLFLFYVGASQPTLCYPVTFLVNTDMIQNPNVGGQRASISRRECFEHRFLVLISCVLAMWLSFGHKHVSKNSGEFQGQHVKYAQTRRMCQARLFSVRIFF